MADYGVWKRLWQDAGVVSGALLAPWFAVGSALRRARFFHPDGLVYDATAEATAAALAAPMAGLAQRLAGPVLVRLSNAWWRGGREWPDVLGIALRFHSQPGAPLALEPTDQDLLLATIPRPMLLPFAPLWTDVHDFLDNVYYGTAPFWVAELGQVRIRLRAVAVGPAQPSPVSPEAKQSRAERLAAAVAQGAARLQLDLSTGAEWVPLVELRLVRALPDIDQQALRFSPFHAGRGIEPSGFIQGLRRFVYPASQAARSLSAA